MGRRGMRSLVRSSPSLTIVKLLMKPPYVCIGGQSGHLRRDRAVCIFEHDTAKPISRHTGDMLNEMGATKGYVLVVRSISTVGKCVFSSFLFCLSSFFFLDSLLPLLLSSSTFFNLSWNRVTDIRAQLRLPLRLHLPTRRND